MNCILYARVSTDKQAEKDLSIPAQLQAMRDYARQHDWSVVEEFLEPGASARTTDRPALQKLLSLVREAESKIDVVLVHKIDRLARNVYDHATIKALLKQRNVRLASVVENMDDSVSGQLVENIMASIAQFYSANLAEETRKGMRQLVLKGGWPHRAPRGYVMVRDVGANVRGSQCDVHPREGALITRGFELFATGLFSVQTVVNRLAKDGLVSSTGGPLSHSHLHRILTNPFYQGRVRWKELDVPGQHTPLVSATVFEKVQRLIGDRSRHNGPKGAIAGLPLRAFATCATCRGRFTAERHGRFAYYRCSRQAYRRTLCNARFCNADRAHADLERILKQVQLNRRTADDIAREAERLISQRAATGSRRQQRAEKGQADMMAREMRLTEAFTAGDVSANIYKETAAALRNTRSRLQRDLERLAVSPESLRSRVTRSLQLATSLFDLYEQFNDIRRVELLRTVFKSIVLGPEGIIGFTLQPPFDALQRLRSSGSPAGRSAALAKSMLDAA